MNINKMLEDMRAERGMVDEAILALERLANRSGKRRGRPPKWMSRAKRGEHPQGSKNKPKADASTA